MSAARMPARFKDQATMPYKILVTGAAGFIGAHVAARLAELGHLVVGCDDFNDYYDPRLKRDRVRSLLDPRNVGCEDIDISNASALRGMIERFAPQLIVHLAAQAGVRYSIARPDAYVKSNLVGFANVIEAARLAHVEHFVYASSSSVYGASASIPFLEAQQTDSPLSFYAATKKANEAMAHAYSHIHGMRCTGLRFFTVYGPWGRPDMAYYSFAQRLLLGQPLPVFAEGRLLRDFTYIDDAVEGATRLALSPLGPGEAPYALFNIGNHQPVSVLDFVRTLGEVMKVEPVLEFHPMQPGDVPATCADVTRLRQRVGFEPSIPLRLGLERFGSWFLDRETRNQGLTGLRT